MSNFSLRKLSIIIMVLLLVLSSVFAFSTVHLTQQISTINDSWSSFKSHHNEKARMLNTLYGVLGYVLGYGGMIHHFKDYLLRKEFNQLIRFERSIGIALEVTNKYLTINPSPAEKLAIKEILNHYQNNLILIIDDINKFKPGVAINSLIEFDDSLALHGLSVLTNEIKTQNEFYSDETNKLVLASKLKADMGYGGMIHNYKHYVLKQDEFYKEQSLISIANVIDIIKQYRNLAPTQAEQTALDDIEQVLKEYQVHTEAISLAIQSGLTPEQIDAKLKIDDSYAIQGLQILEQDILKQIGKESEALSTMLITIHNREKLNGILVISFTITLAVFIFWVFTKKIIQPVKRMSELMLELAKGNIKIDTDHHANHINIDSTELQKMESSLRVFQENELQRRNAEEKIRQMALTDPLTGLANRNHFEMQYPKTIALSKREKKSLTLLAIDLDDFKPINDEFGHAAGDLMLKSAAEKMLLTFRETDLVTRIGGDEFLVLLYGTSNLEGVIETVKRLISMIAIPVSYGKEMLSVGVSVGIAQHHYDSSNSLEMLMKYADEALYEAKNSGKNTYAVYKDKSQVIAKKSLTPDLIQH